MGSKDNTLLEGKKVYFVTIAYLENCVNFTYICSAWNVNLVKSRKSVRSIGSTYYRHKVKAVAPISLSVTRLLYIAEPRLVGCLRLSIVVPEITIAWVAFAVEFPAKTGVGFSSWVGNANN